MSNLMKSEIYYLNNLSKNAGYVDVFGKLIADGTTNELDIASHYPYSPERWVIRSNGTKIFPEYQNSINDLNQYTHNLDVHELTPSAGETIVFQTAEYPRYVVQYEQEATFSFSINQLLQTGDRIRVGNYNDNGGWFFEQNGSHDKNKCDLVIRRNGVDKKKNNIRFT